jgi:hypothetical protein
VSTIGFDEHARDLVDRVEPPAELVVDVMARRQI